MTAFYEWLSEASLWWWPRFADHLWQTTLFVLVVSVAAFTLRRGPARMRHNFWLLASAKFIVPAVLFVFLAQGIGIDSLPIFRRAPPAEQSALLLTGVTEPATAIALDYEVTVIANPSDDHKQVYFALTAVWLAGCLVMLSVRAIRRRQFVDSLRLGRRLQKGREWQALECARTTLGLQADIGLVISPLKIEPAAWGVWRPLVVMPESIAGQLDDEELEAIMLHELVHIQRRDNLIGNLQLIVCALLWFHPLVWFISRRLFDEREQACDERVMEVCGAPEAYASSILKVVRFCFGWKVAGVTGAAGGSNLRRRIENIMTIGNKERGSGAPSGLLASALVVIALLVLVGAGVYSKAQGRNSSDLEVASVEMTSSSNPEVAFSLANVLGWNTQKTKRAIPPPPPPPQPLQPAQPPTTAQPSMPPPPPPEPVQSAQPARAPQPSPRPNPSSVPQPAQAPDPSSVPQPPQAPDPATAPLPAQVHPTPPTPAPGRGLQPAHPLPTGMATGKGAVTSFGRGVAGGASIAPARAIGTGATIAPARATSGAALIAGGRGFGSGVTIAPARATSGAASIAGGRGFGSGAVMAPARSIGGGVSNAGGRGAGIGASIANGRGVGTGVSVAGGRGIATGVGRSAPRVAPARVAPASPRAAPAPRPLPVKPSKTQE
jgi:beta-lactamase regulating signal transducer with metallopeptidase domain